MSELKGSRDPSAAAEKFPKPECVLRALRGGMAREGE